VGTSRTWRTAACAIITTNIALAQTATAIAASIIHITCTNVRRCTTIPVWSGAVCATAGVSSRWTALIGIWQVGTAIFHCCTTYEQWVWAGHFSESELSSKELCVERTIAVSKTILLKNLPLLFGSLHGVETERQSFASGMRCVRAVHYAASIDVRVACWREAEQGRKCHRQSKVRTRHLKIHLSMVCE